MDTRCTTPLYDQLYARWLDAPGTLLDVCGYQPGMKLLDLCGGTGAVSLEALRRGADPSTITLVDLNPRCPDKRITQLQGDANDLGAMFGPLQPDCLHSFDRVIIRQAAAYLDWGLGLLWLTALLKADGMLAFNTFTQPRWRLHTYRHGGRRFLEASAYLGQEVVHLQLGFGIGADVTRFRWHTEEFLRDRLGDGKLGFRRVEVQRRGRTQTWLCSDSWSALFTENLRRTNPDHPYFKMGGR